MRVKCESQVINIPITLKYSKLKTKIVVSDGLLEDLSIKEMESINGGWKLLDKIGYAIGETIGELAWAAGEVAKELDKAIILKQIT